MTLGQIQIPFVVNAQGRIATVSDPTTAAEQRLLSYLLTRPGERVMRGKFGTVLSDYMFTNVDPLRWEMLNQTISDRVAADVQGIVLQTLGAAQDSTTGAVVVTVGFTLTLGGAVGSSNTSTITVGGST